MNCRMVFMKRKLKWLSLFSFSISPIFLSASCYNKTKNDSNFSNELNSQSFLNLINNSKKITKEQLILKLNNYLVNHSTKSIIKDLNVKNENLVIYANNQNYQMKNVNLEKINSGIYPEIINNSYKLEKNSNSKNSFRILFSNLPISYTNKEKFETRIWTENNANGYNSLSYRLPNLQLLSYLAQTTNLLNDPFKNPKTEMRIEGFLASKLQQEKYLNELLFYIKEFNFDENIQKISFKSLVKTNNYLTATLDFLDDNNKSLLNQNDQIKIYLDEFQNNENFYAQYKDVLTNKTLNLNDDLENVNLVLFNEQYQNPTIKFKDNILGINEYDQTMHPDKKYKQFNINLFKYLFDNYQDLIEITNVENKNIKIEKFEFSKLLNNSLSIGKLFLNDGQKTYPWFSINFTPHKHLFDGFIIKNELGLFSKLNSQNYFSYNTLKKENNQIEYPQGIDANEFFEQNFIDIVNFLIEENISNLILWNNFPMHERTSTYIVHNKNEFEKKLSLLFSQLVLLYYITNKENNTLIKEVKVKILDDDTNFGSIYLNFDFIDHNNQSLLNNNLKNQKYELKGFKGTNYKLIDEKRKELESQENKEYLEQPIKNQTLPYLKKAV